MNRDGLFPGGDGNVYVGRLPVTVIYSLKCSVCVGNTEMPQRVSVGGCVPYPTIPEGWQWLGDQLICPKHDIAITNKVFWCDACQANHTSSFRECPKHRVRVEDATISKYDPSWACSACGYKWTRECVPPTTCPSCKQRQGWSLPVTGVEDAAPARPNGSFCTGCGYVKDLNPSQSGPGLYCWECLQKAGESTI